MKENSLTTYESIGITPSYNRRTLAEYSTRNLKRKSSAARKTLLSQDKKIHEHNSKLQKAQMDVNIAEARLRNHQNAQSSSDIIQKANAVLDKAQKSYRKTYSTGVRLINTGTGKARITFLPLFRSGSSSH
ncbi:MAG: hypothetical protein NXY57DRAFT_968836 [Lentinula lateritia]|nr:MAG: hypothetical protein NXY57DRAFT_968836 [Lentinula lateritia]